MRTRNKVLVALVSGILLTSTPFMVQSAAARHHASADTTKVGIRQSIDESSTKEMRLRPDVDGSVREGSSLSDRINAILHPTPVPEPPPEPKQSVRVNYDTDSIFGEPAATEEQCVRYLLSVNPNPDISVSPRELVSYYYEEGSREGIRPDVAFAQALKETGFFRYGGTVTPDQNNYCGLGTTSATVKGAYFPSAELGVRAHIQHLLAYASTRRPVEPVVDPRFDLVRQRYGSMTLTRWEDLNGRWAVPGTTYGQSILSMWNAICRQ